MNLTLFIYIVIFWLAFDAIVFLWAFSDHFYYSHNVKNTLKKIKDNITEE